MLSFFSVRFWVLRMAISKFVSKHLSLCSLLIAAFFSFVSVPQGLGQEIRVAYSNFPPLTGSYLNKDNPGLLMEIYSYVLTDLGYQPKLVQFPPKRIALNMESGIGIDLYACGEFSRGKRLKYLYGPKLLTLTAVLLQRNNLPPLEKIEDLKDQVIIKQRGFGGLARLVDPSNKIDEANFKSLVPMFLRGRASYLLDFKERLIPLLEDVEVQGYRLYELRKYGSYLCLNKRFDHAEKRLQDIHDGMVAFQDTDEGKALFKKYKYSGRFGDQAP